MPRVGLTTAKVVEQAADVADETGWDTLSLAAVASRCGVRIPSLYKHIPSLNGLRLEVSALALRELAAELTAAALGRATGDAVRAIAHAYRSYALAHPGRYAATVPAPSDRHAGQQDAAREALEVVQAALAGYGLADDDAIHAARALRASLHGFVHLETNDAFGLPTDIDRSFRRLVDGLDATLSTFAADGWKT